MVFNTLKALRTLENRILGRELDSHNVLTHKQAVTYLKALAPTVHGNLVICDLLHPLVWYDRPIPEILSLMETHFEDKLLSHMPITVHTERYRKPGEEKTYFDFTGVLDESVDHKRIAAISYITK